MWLGVKVKTRGAMPMDAAKLRARLRIDTAAEDDLLADFIATAASEIEGPDGWGIALMGQTWTLTLDRLAGEITLPGWPVSGVSEVRYTDPDGAAQVLDPAEYRVVAGVDPVKVLPAAGRSWPAVQAGPGVVEIDYTLGQAAAGDVDPGLITALALLAGHYYENREATLPGSGVKELPLGVSHMKTRFSRAPVAG